MTETRQLKTYQSQSIAPRKRPLANRQANRSTRTQAIKRPLFYNWQFQRPLEEKARLFKEEALKYENIESDASYQGDFRAYYTTYQDLPPRVLEGYFGWRTRLRKGNYESAPLSFKFLYIYELLAQIGVSSALEGYQKLKQVQQAYPDANLQRYLTSWLQDYVLYYDLGESYIQAEFGQLIDEDRIRAVLISPQSASEEKIVSAMTAISTYDMKRSAFIKKYPEITQMALSRIYLKLCSNKDANPSKLLQQVFCGLEASFTYKMFDNAVFYPEERDHDGHYVIDSLRQFDYCQGVWTCRSFGGNQPLKKVSKMGAIIRETDRILRTLFDCSPLKPQQIDPFLEKLIQETCQEVYDEEQAKKHPPISVNLNILGQIRSDADETMDSLLVEDDSNEEIYQEKLVEPIRPSDEELAKVTDDELLSPIEMTFLQLILEEKDYSDFLKKHHLMASLLVDTINEKVMEDIGDIILELDDTNRYVLISDYEEEVRNLLQHT